MRSCRSYIVSGLISLCLVGCIKPEGEEPSPIFVGRVYTNDRGVRVIDVTYEELVSAVRVLAAEGIAPEQADSRMGLPAYLNTVDGMGQKELWDSKSFGLSFTIRSGSSMPIQELYRSAQDAAYWGEQMTDHFRIVGIIWLEDGSLHVFEGEETFRSLRGG
jgi:hypothetical protein